MIRRLALAVAASLALFLGSPASADAPRGGGCGGEDSSPACPPGGSGITCEQCTVGLTSCSDPLEQQGYTRECQRGSVVYWCKSAGAAPARAGFTLPLAGLLLAASVWSSARIGRRRAKRS